MKKKVADVILKYLKAFITNVATTAESFVHDDSVKQEVHRSIGSSEKYYRRLRKLSIDW
jgi:hypothetical protein